jgi:hypothetical protein
MLEVFEMHCADIALAYRCGCLFISADSLDPSSLDHCKRGHALRNLAHFNTFVLTSQAHLGSHLQITQHNTASAPYSRVKASCHAIAAAKGKRQAYHNHHHHTCTRVFSVIALSAQRCPLPHTSALVLARAGVSNIPNSHFRKPSQRPRDTFTNNFRALCSRSRKSYATSSLI